jgi:hypothetical protein
MLKFSADIYVQNMKYSQQAYISFIGQAGHIEIKKPEYLVLKTNHTPEFDSRQFKLK